MAYIFVSTKTIFFSISDGENLVDDLGIDLIHRTRLNVFGSMVRQKVSKIAFELAMAEKDVLIVYVFWQTLAVGLLICHHCRYGQILFRLDRHEIQ